MSLRRTPLAPGEWYHCYTRGIDGRNVFASAFDYERFTEALYISNAVEVIPRNRFQHDSHEDILNVARGESIVAVGAYALMPNHFHLLLKEIQEGGISKFMQRLGTSYTMYFNKKYQHIGNVLVGPFRSKHIGADSYLRRIVSYIHLNPAEIFEHGWKEGRVKDVRALEKYLKEFPHSSLPDYTGTKRPENNVLAWSDIEDLLRWNTLPIKKLLPEAVEYYAGLP